LREDQAPDDPLEAVPDDHQPPPDAVLMDRQAMAALMSALRRLPPRQSQVFLLRLWEGLGVEETAGIMGISAGSVKTHYSRAVASLRQRLEDHRP
jgi:RNA polymerase sigma-70 factor (ECF subfamily)